jgi:hypothetical protein
MAHTRAAAAQRRKRVIEIDAVRELKVRMLPIHADHADAVFEHAIGRPVEEHDRAPHREDVLVAWRRLFDDQRSKAEREGSNVGIVAAEELEQLARRLRHRGSLRRDRTASMRSWSRAR